MGSILAASIQGGRCGARGFMNETTESDGKVCRFLAGLFLCSFGLTAYYCTKPETFWLKVARVGILTITGTSALIILTPYQMVKTTLKRIKRPDFASMFKFPQSEKLALPLTYSIEKSKKLTTIVIPSKIETKSPLRSPPRSPLQSSLKSYENISTVS